MARRRSSRDWPESVRLAALVARHQGMEHAAIAAAMSVELGRAVSAASVRFFCHRYGATRPRLAPFVVPAGYAAEYDKLRYIMGAVKARAEVLRLVERDRARREAQKAAAD